MNKTIVMLAAPALTLLAVGAAAQTITYRCTGADGKRYYGSTLPQQCFGRPAEQLNAQGLVVKRIDPQASERERQAKEAEEAKKKEEDAAAREASRRNRALLATYTSEKDIDEARTRALADNQKAVAEVEAHIAELKKRQAGYDREMQFYKGKTKPPAQLAEDIRNVAMDLRAQEELLAAKKREVDGINNRYDEDKKRYLELTKRN